VLALVSSKKRACQLCTNEGAGASWELNAPHRFLPGSNYTKASEVDRSWGSSHSRRRFPLTGARAVRLQFDCGCMLQNSRVSGMQLRARLRLQLPKVVYTTSRLDDFDLRDVGVCVVRTCRSPVSHDGDLRSPQLRGTFRPSKVVLGPWSLVRPPVTFACGILENFI
jgi:hypothetical protein